MKTIHVAFACPSRPFMGPLLGVLEWARACVESVPEEYREIAELDYELGTISYERLETDDERAARERRKGE